MNKSDAHCSNGAQSGKKAPNQWHGWPDEMPPRNGHYLVIMSDRCGNRKLAIRVFRDKDWIFTVKTDIDYWMEIPQMPIPL